MILFLSFLLFPNIFEQLSQRRLLESGRSLERGVEYKLNVVRLRGGVYGKKRCPRGGVSYIIYGIPPAMGRGVGGGGWGFGGQA